MFSPLHRKSAAVKAVEAKLGYSIPGPFDHVMFGVEKCYLECGWAAYAGVNSWFSVYQGNNYKYPAVSLHEVGLVKACFEFPLYRH